jgi:hypothetical protein
LQKIAFALGLSLLLHAALVCIPAGEMGRHFQHAKPFIGSDPATISIRIDPLPPNSPLSQKAKKPAIQSPSQSAIDNDSSNHETKAHDQNTIVENAWSPQEKTPVFDIPPPHYYRPEELSQRAQIVSEIDPALGNLVETPGTGKAILLLWINEEGKVDRTNFQSSTLAPLFEDAIQQQFCAARFQPAEIGSTKVKSLMKIEVELLPQSIPAQNE